MADALSRSDAPTWWQRAIVAVLAAVVVVHCALVILWLAPSSPVRDAVGAGRLATYVDPYFQQSADTVGLDSERVDESFSVRALVRPEAGGAVRPTRWVDLTTTEDRATRHELDSGRAHLVARRLATNLNLAMFHLTTAQRSIVSKISAEDLPSVFGARLAAAGHDPVALQTYLSYDQMAREFASLYARARWPGSTVYEVQFKVGRRTVPTYASHDRRALDDVAYRYFAFGWRAAYRGTVEAQTAFDSYVKRA